MDIVDDNSVTPGEPPFLLPRQASPPPATPSVGEIRSQITGVRKIVSNYETYVTYGIKTQANREDYPSELCVVERRYREFDWLHRRLQETYVVLFVPPLPGKKVLTQFNRYASGFVDSRCSGLQTFIRKSTAHPVLSANPHLIAFLTLPQAAFQDYMQGQRTESSIFGELLSGAVAGPRRHSAFVDWTRQSTAVDSSAQRQPPSHPLPVSPPPLPPSISYSRANDLSYQSLIGASERFAQYRDEVTEYTTTCQKLSALINRISSQLTALSFDYASLATNLNDLPVAGGDGRRVGSASTPVAPVSGAMRQTAMATQNLASILTVDLENTWHDAANFGEAVKAVLKNREAIQAQYVNTKEQIEARVRSGEEVQTTPPPVPEADVAPSWVARFAVMPWAKKNKKPLDSLLRQVGCMEDELTFANGQIESEWCRWRDFTRVEETAATMTALAQAYANFWTSIAQAWRDASTTIDATATALPTAPQLRLLEGENGVVDSELISFDASAKLDQ